MEKFKIVKEGEYMITIERQAEGKKEVEEAIESIFQTWVNAHSTQNIQVTLVK